MPDISGLELLQHVRKNGELQNVPVISESSASGHLPLHGCTINSPHSHVVSHAELHCWNHCLSQVSSVVVGRRLCSLPPPAPCLTCISHRFWKCGRFLDVPGLGNSIPLATSNIAICSCRSQSQLEDQDDHAYSALGWTGRTRGWTMPSV